jgi:integrase
VYLGWRQPEVLALRWQDIDQVAGVIRLRQTVVREKRPGGYGLVIRPYGKTSGTTRTVPYPSGLTPFLQRQTERIARLRTMAGDRWVDHDLVCPSAVGRPMDGRNVTRHFQDVLHAAGLRRWAFHDLRHAAASLLIAVETPIEQVQEILGHRQLSTTADIYAHLYPGATRAAMDRLSDAISGELGVELGVTGDDPLPIPMLESKNP